MGKVMEQGGMGETQRLEGRKVVAGLELRAGPERRLKLELDLGLGLGMGWDWLQDWSPGRDLR